MKMMNCIDLFLLLVFGENFISKIYSETPACEPLSIYKGVSLTAWVELNQLGSNQTRYQTLDTISRTENIKL